MSDQNSADSPDCGDENTPRATTARPDGCSGLSKPVIASDGSSQKVHAASPERGHSASGSDPAFHWSPELLTDMVSAKARRDGKAIKLSTYAGEIDRKSAVELRDWLDAVLGDKPAADPWPAFIVQAAKPGDVVIVEAQRDLSIDDMERIKKMIDAAALGLKVVIFPHDLKVARGRLPDPPEDTDGVIKKGI